MAYCQGATREIPALLVPHLARRMLRKRNVRTETARYATASVAACTNLLRHAEQWYYVCTRQRA
jgi:hypothetical protein